MAHEKSRALTCLGPAPEETTLSGDRAVHLLSTKIGGSFLLATDWNKQTFLLITINSRPFYAAPMIGDKRYPSLHPGAFDRFEGVRIPEP